MSKRTILIVLTVPFIKTLTIFSLITRWMIQLLDFIVSIRTIIVTAIRLTTLNMRVAHFTRVASLVTFIVIEMAAGKLVHI